jgi:hypothetical protein
VASQAGYLPMELPGEELVMRGLRSPARAAASLAAAGMTVLMVLVAACSAAGQPTSHAVTPLPMVKTIGPARPQPVRSRTRREAQLLARRILTRLSLPPGAQPVHPGHLPQLLRRPSTSPAGPGWVDARSLFQLSGSVASVKQYLLTHRPVGARLEGTGDGGSDEATVQFVQFSLVPPPGFEDAGLVVSVIPHAGGSLLRTDGQVIWFPARSAAEQLVVGQFKVVRLTAQVFNPRPHVVRRVITSPGVIARLARLLNGFPAEPDLATSCPAIWVIYRFAFAATARGPARAVITDTSCRSATVRAGGKVQPALQDTGGKLYQAAQRLIPVKDPS